MIATKETVHKLIPQEPPMEMVDTLIYHDEQKTITGFHIQKDNIFVEGGVLTEEGMIENMAQSSALRFGWIGHSEKGKEQFSPSVGVIGAIKNFKLYHNPKVNTSINTSIHIQLEVFNAIVVLGKVFLDDVLMAEAELKIFIQTPST